MHKNHYFRYRLDNTESRTQHMYILHPMLAGSIDEGEMAGGGATAHWLVETDDSRTMGWGIHWLHFSPEFDHHHKGSRHHHTMP